MWSFQDEDGTNREVERIANIMLHDGISPDEQDSSELEKYTRQVRLETCGFRGDDDISEMSETDCQNEAAKSIIYEALLYRKLKNVADNSGSILDRGSKFGAGFS